MLFGPFAAFTTKFLLRSGSRWDLPRTVKFTNIGSLAKVGLYNLPLVKYLIQQGTQSMAARMKVLQDFYPEARREDWNLVDAGICVQAIKKEDGAAGIVHNGTEVVTDADKSIVALLGASPGASVFRLDHAGSPEELSAASPGYRAQRVDHEANDPDLQRESGSRFDGGPLRTSQAGCGCSAPTCGHRCVRKVRSSIKVTRGFSTMKKNAT